VFSEKVAESTGGGEHFWSLPPQAGAVDAALQVDLSSQPTGVYNYSLTTGINLFVPRGFVGSSSTVAGKIIQVNSITSPFGSGWGLAGCQQLFVNNDGSVLLVDGNGQEQLFQLPARLHRDLLVPSYNTNSILRYDQTTGALLGAFVPSGSGGLAGPISAIFGPDGNLYVTSQATNSILRYDGTTGVFKDAFVAPGSGGLNTPEELLFGPDGNLYVDTRLTNQVLRYNGTTGAFIDVFASGGGLSRPLGMAFGPDGNLYVSSNATVSILRYDGKNGTFLNTFVASGSGGLAAPTKLVFGPDGNLYVTDYQGNQVLRYNGKSGAFMDVFAAGNGLKQPDGLSFGPDGNLYVSSTGTNSVLRYNGTTGAFIDVFVASGEGGLSDPLYSTFFPAIQSGGAISYTSPQGDFSTLEKLPDGTFQRTLKDQTVYTFNAQNMLASVRDRNGNQTQFIYDNAGRLLRVVDPAGLATTLTYSGSQVSTITDPVGRTTQLAFDAAGNLVSITDPDGSQLRWEYDAGHHQTAFIDKRGQRGEDFYDFAGRATKAIRRDGTVVQVSPVEVQGLYPADATTDPTSPPLAVVIDNAMASYADGNGNVVHTLLNQAGQAISSSDAAGPLPLVQRNSQNLVTQLTDARGNTTHFVYDSRGNLTSQSDAAPAVPVVQLPRDFSSVQGSNNLFFEEYGDNRPTNTQNPSSTFAKPLPFVGTVNITNGSATSTGPQYADASDFPFILQDVSRNLLILHPGSGGTNLGGGTANIGASVTFVAPTDGTFHLTGDFARFNDFRSAGDGVDVAIIKNFDAAHLLFASTISSNNAVNPDDPFAGTGVASFSLDVTLTHGDAVRFVVFSDAQGQDGTFDATALRLTITNSTALHSASSGPPAFSAPTTIPVGTYPRSVAVGDLARNGDLDLVTANYADNTVSVLIGHGDGTFAPRQDYPVGNQPWGMVVGDVNGDGIPDIVTANRGDKTVSVLLGKGDGTFGPRTDYPAGSARSPWPWATSTATATLTSF
jgi:YD repeat-containing protein